MKGSYDTMCYIFALNSERVLATYVIKTCLNNLVYSFLSEIIIKACNQQNRYNKTTNRILTIITSLVYNKTTTRILTIICMQANFYQGIIFYSDVLEDNVKDEIS